MCGIVGYCGKRPAYPLLINGLKKLEYRGYDSAGVALQENGTLTLYKRKGEINNLQQSLAEEPAGETGIGHTRWATHGRPSDENAHPHKGCDKRFMLVHNGIIENYALLREELKTRGHTFSSETDTEVLVHLVEETYRGDLLAALKDALTKVRGSYAVVLISAEHTGELVCARKDSPMVIGIGKGENFVASDIPALLEHTREIVVLEDGDFARLTQEKVEIFDKNMNIVQRSLLEINWDVSAAEKSGYKHFMIKEIMEQPRAVRDTLRSRLTVEGDIDLSTDINLSPEQARSLSRITIVACGTAYHAGLVGKYLLERLAKLPVEVDFASEFRYRRPMLNKKDMVLLISQSGETADTLAALRLAREQCPVSAITNVVGSSVSREADHVLYTWAGPEIAVASTKAYVTQLAALYLLAIDLGTKRGTLPEEERKNLTAGLQKLPQLLEELLAEQEAVEKIAKEIIAPWEDTFFVGRLLDYAVALEGALKLKEISYIHAEAYAAGELKHGTLALITNKVPVIALATQGDVLEKTVSNVQEIKARDAHIIGIAMDNEGLLASQSDSFICLPAMPEILAPIMAVVPLQLLAYYASVARGCPVDKPRNLAKSVTVE